MFRLIQRTFTSKHSKETLESLTYYEILNVRPDSTKEQIRKNYLKLARKFHPDLQIEPNVMAK